MNAVAVATPTTRPLPPDSVRTTVPRPKDCARVVLIRHGEAVCNVDGVVGGVVGCTGLTDLGVTQVMRLRDRIAMSGELSDTAVLYSSVLPRALQTAEILCPALAGSAPGTSLEIVEDCSLCELHPGAADGLTWAQFSERFGEPDWESDPLTPISPGGESWLGFVERAASAVQRIADSHRGELVVVATHAGVVEATMLSYLPVDPRKLRRGWIRTNHASMTEWERSDRGWTLVHYNG
ncbi:MAG: histidine phosphatase family protein [Actinobacteria bacterium]|nr:histidine phosphatase family protein [Actinomycetota bacterium]